MALKVTEKTGDLIYASQDGEKDYIGLGGADFIAERGDTATPGSFESVPCRIQKRADGISALVVSKTSDGRAVVSLRAGTVLLFWGRQIAIEGEDYPIWTSDFSSKPRKAVVYIQLNLANALSSTVSFGARSGTSWDFRGVEGDDLLTDANGWSRCDFALIDDTRADSLTAEKVHLATTEGQDGQPERTRAVASVGWLDSKGKAAVATHAKVAATMDRMTQAVRTPGSGALIMGDTFQGGFPGFFPKPSASVDIRFGTGQTDEDFYALGLTAAISGRWKVNLLIQGYQGNNQESEVGTPFQLVNPPNEREWPSIGERFVPATVSGSLIDTQAYISPRRVNLFLQKSSGKIGITVGFIKSILDCLAVYHVDFSGNLVAQHNDQGHDYILWKRSSTRDHDMSAYINLIDTQAVGLIPSVGAEYSSPADAFGCGVNYSLEHAQEGARLRLTVKADKVGAWGNSSAFQIDLSPMRGYLPMVKGSFIDYNNNFLTGWKPKALIIQPASGTTNSSGFPLLIAH